MNYYWLDCSRCGCQITVNATLYPDRISGSLRRWSADRTVNDGRSFEVAAATRTADGSFAVSCVCGHELLMPSTPSAVGTERDPNLRVTLE